MYIVHYTIYTVHTTDYANVIILTAKYLCSVYIHKILISETDRNNYHMHYMYIAIQYLYIIKYNEIYNQKVYYFYKFYRNYYYIY